MRLIDADKLKPDCITKDGRIAISQSQLANAPTIDLWEMRQEATEINHRLNLLIGVLYSNRLISDNDLKYIEDSIKKLMKGGAV